MRDRIKQGNSLFAVLRLWILLGIVLFSVFIGTGIAVRAEESNFVIDATMLPVNSATYDVRINIENMGPDWEGTVRVIVDEEYRCPSAYDTVISLPQGSTKQFVVKVPVDSMEETDGTIRVSLWDKKSRKTTEKEFSRLLMDDADALSMGILSDDYSTLTYLDMGGEELYFYGKEYPIKLVELKQGSITDALDSLEFLVIDTYNTGVLTDEELKAIELWNYDGGVLVVGTGSYAEDTLKGLGDSYLEMQCGKIYAPGEVSQSYSDYVDFSQLSIAELRDLRGQYTEQYLCNARTTAMGDGSVGILPYALTELAKMDDTFYQGYDQEFFVQNMLELVSSEASSRYSGSSYYAYDSGVNMIRRMLGMVGNSNSPLQFGVLKFLVVAYVIFVGPILYLILRFMKKRELYWVAVPVATVAGIILVFLAGRGFEVVDTRVYSVTAENLSDKGGSKTYLYCYDANRKEWDLKLSEGYEYVGALMNDNYNYDYEEDSYYYHMKKEGDTLSFGIKPGSSFEDSYFCAGKSRENTENVGTIESYGIMSDMMGIQGTVTNGTKRDFLYYAVIVNGALYVYEDLPAGETCNLAEQIPVHISAQGYSIWSNYTYDFLDDVYDDKGAESAGMAAALGVGLCSAYPENDIYRIVVIGVTEDWEKTVDDNCSEISYGCLYTIQ